MTTKTGYESQPLEQVLLAAAEVASNCDKHELARELTFRAKRHGSRQATLDMLNERERNNCKACKVKR